jgi:hypothetical protein
MIVFAFGDTMLSQVHRAAVRAHLRRRCRPTALVHMNTPGAARLAHAEALEDGIRVELVQRKADESERQLLHRLRNKRISYWLAFHLQESLARGRTAGLVEALRRAGTPGCLVQLSADGHTLKSEDF